MLGGVEPQVGKLVRKKRALGEKMERLNAISIILRSFRNGLYYGTKIRAPHAFVMTFLFRKGTLASKLRSIIRLTYEHTKNLGLFVGSYKFLLLLLKAIDQNLSSSGLRKQLIDQLGSPERPWHAALAGGLAGYYIWAKYSGVNYQIVMYLLSRILIAGVKLLAQKQVQPFAQYHFKHVYPHLAAVVWAIVMWLFENYPETLHPSLEKSMVFLYHDSNRKWTSNFAEYLPSPATAFVLLATWLNI